MRSIVFASFCALLTFAPGIPSKATAAAGCSSSFRFCDNCKTRISVIPKKNTVCVIPYRVIGGALFSQRVVKRGLGIYGTTDVTAGAYQPKPNFVGKDYFEIEIDYERSGSKFRTTIQADVSVTE